MPFASCVLPAPKSPLSPMTHPLFAVRPHSAPSASVASALLEMNVAMGFQWMRAALVADAHAFTRDDFADAAKLQFGKLLLPCVQQRDCIATGDGEQQFKIFAVR